MNNLDLRRFSPVGLVISGLAALISFVLFILQRSFNLPLQISLGFVFLGIALTVLLDPQRAREVLTGRQARYGSNSFLMAIAVIGILVVLNFLVKNNSKQWDLTEDKQNTLTPETIQILNSLKSPVKAEAYFSSQVSPDTAQKLLQNYQLNSKGKFTFEFIDPNKDAIRTQQAKIAHDGTIVLKMDDRQEQVTSSTEEDLSGGLVRLANPGKRSVYFLTGHGEKSIESSSDTNDSQLVSTLRAKNYTVATLNLLANPAIPDDALAIIVSGPQKPLSDQEIALIKAFQEKGKALVYLAEPLIPAQGSEAVDPMIGYLETTWGIALDEDIILDFSPNNNQHDTVYSNQFGSHAITQKMNSLVLQAPTTRSVRLDKQVENVTVTELVHTSENAWGETDFTTLLNEHTANPDPAKDRIGPLPFAAAGENQTTHARVVVTGDSDFASSSFFNNYGNGDFILNSIDWAAQQDNLISLTPRQPIQRMMVPPDPITMNLILLGSVFLLPGLVIFTGIYVWVQRRRKG
jgi:ABC-type uncharacterized transport system involved in gliding motility auxiliary subunit